MNLLDSDKCSLPVEGISGWNSPVSPGSESSRWYCRNIYGANGASGLSVRPNRSGLCPSQGKADAIQVGVQKSVNDAKKSQFRSMY